MESKKDLLGAKFNHALEQVEVPPSLFKFAYDVPNKVEQQMPSKRKKSKNIPKWAVSLVAASVIYIGAVYASPTFASLVGEVPFFGLPASWLHNNVGNYEGKQDAAHHGYSPFSPVTVTIDGNKVSINSMTLEEGTLSFMAKVEGDIIKNKDVTTFTIKPRGFGEEVPGVVSYDQYIEDQTIILDSRFDLTEEQVAAFLEEQPQALDLLVTGLGDPFSLSVPFDPSKLASSIVYSMKQDIPLADYSSIIKDATIHEVTILPTSMRVDLNVEVTEGYGVDFAAKIKDFPYLTDENGKRYELNLQSKYSSVVNHYENQLSLEFTPSVYFRTSKPKELTLHLNKAWILTGEVDHYDITELNLEVPLKLENK